MRKILIVLMVSLGLIVATACSSNDNTNKQNNEGNEQAETNEQGLEVEKGLLNVEVTVPSFLFEDDNPDDIIAATEAEGKKEATLNDDGSITYKMTKSDYKKLMKEMREDTIEYVNDIKNDEEFVSIEDITYNKSFTEFTVVVDKDSFENSFDGFAVFGLGMRGIVHQVYDGKDVDNTKVTINVTDSSSKEVINTIVFPDDLQDEEED